MCIIVVDLLNSNTKGYEAIENHIPNVNRRNVE